MTENQINGNGNSAAAVNGLAESVFTVQELASYLRMKPLTIYKHASAGKLPGFKVGSHWRFKKKTIDQWIQDQENSTTSSNRVN